MNKNHTNRIDAERNIPQRSAMEQIRQIWEHPLYRKNFEMLQEQETERIFCNHTLEHFLDVARIMRIFDLEQTHQMQSEAPSGRLKQDGAQGAVGVESAASQELEPAASDETKSSVSHPQTTPHLETASHPQSVPRSQEPLEKTLIYAAALLHDLGRAEENLTGTPHHEAGAKLSAQIMKDCGFSMEEIHMVCEAILNHRGSVVSELDGEPKNGLQRARETERDAARMRKGRRLAELLYRADKKSRCCFACPAAAECNWSDEKKNLQIEI